MRMRKKKNLAPRMDACGALLVSDPAAEKGRWRERKPDAVKLRLELGCGKGRFTAETAAAHPGDLYVAVERVPDAMVIAMERCQALGLTNVLFIDGDAAALDEYFAPGEVDLIYINFCDPWPSVKHSRRRLTHEGFLRGYRRVLRDGGEIHFKTDNRDLFEWSLFQFPKAGFALSEVTRNLHEHGVQGVMTDYEEKFHALGTPINRCVGTMGPLPDVPLSELMGRRLPGWGVRPATPEDLPALLALSKLWAEEEITYGYAPTSPEAFTNCRCWVAEAEGKLVGYAAGRVEEAQRDIEIQKSGDRYFELEELYAHPDFRSQGIGRLLLERVEREARQDGLTLLMLNAANRAHAPLLNFYLREGLTPHHIRLFKTL
mgnify:CR=1 FL=1